MPLNSSNEPNGTLIEFMPDINIFPGYAYQDNFVGVLLKNYVFLNSGLSIYFNGKKFFSKNGLVDLLNEQIT